MLFIVERDFRITSLTILWILGNVVNSRMVLFCQCSDCIPGVWKVWKPMGYHVALWLSVYSNKSPSIIHFGIVTIVTSISGHIYMCTCSHAIYLWLLRGSWNISKNFSWSPDAIFFWIQRNPMVNSYTNIRLLPDVRTPIMCIPYDPYSVLCTKQQGLLYTSLL